MPRMTAADAAVAILRREGISCVFGLPGAAINPFYAAMRRDGGINHTLARHVEGASHMAEGYTRARAGNIGVCVGTSGPAGTDMITGLYSASADSIPILCITGQAPVARLHKEDFQAVDIAVIAILVSGPAMAAMSTAWKSSLCSLATGAWPVMHRIGIESALAEYRPVIMSVPAGPEVPTHTPMLPARARV